MAQGHPRILGSWDPGALSRRPTPPPFTSRGRLQAKPRPERPTPPPYTSQRERHRRLPAAAVYKQSREASARRHRRIPADARRHRRLTAAAVFGRRDPSARRHRRISADSRRRRRLPQPRPFTSKAATRAPAASPPWVFNAVVRLLFNGWPTRSRCGQLRHKCLLCSCEQGDILNHIMQCSIVRSCFVAYGVCPPGILQS
jgi:hypothetical protein